MTWSCYLTSGSYCAYACLYITMCLIKIFTTATATFEEQYRHIAGLQNVHVSPHTLSFSFSLPLPLSPSLSHIAGLQNVHVSHLPA